MEYRNLNRRGTVLDKEQLEKYLEKLASDHILQKNSDKDTYPIPKVKENFAVIEEVYNLLSEHIKLGIPIHPAGEWLLDNFYIIDETVKTIIKDMTLEKYSKFLGVANGLDKGFARVYVLAYEIISFTDNKIDYKNVSNLLCAYQRKKALSMEEIWNVGIFMQIALIQNIRDICEKIYFSQMQKYRVENILERLVEKRAELKYKNLSEYRARVKGYGEMKYPFIEYLAYNLKKQGKSAYPFMMALEEQVNKMGTTIDEVVKKEHFDIALKKVSMANCITSMKELLRMDFLSIFEQSNGVEEILKKDPIEVYSKMNHKTKEYYRNSIKEIAKKTKISEFYIANKALELAQNAKKEQKENTCAKQMHIGYYLVDEGKSSLYETLQVNYKKVKKSTKVNAYIALNIGLPFILSCICGVILKNRFNILLPAVIMAILLWFPIQAIIVQIVQYVLGKIVKPKMIPRLDFQDGIPKEYATFVVIPTILKNKEKVRELMKKLEVYYLANKSENLYFALLGDCSSGQNKQESFDKEVIQEALEQVEILNKKYSDENFMQDDMPFPKFHFIYRKRYWNGAEECYLGWERKRGLLNQFNEYILGKEDDPFFINTIKKEQNIPKIKYIITLDADTQLTLDTGLELIGCMAHVLNTPILNSKKDRVVQGHALIQPRVGITLEAADKNIFTKIFAGNGGVDAYANAISDVYQDNFGEGIFTGKGIYDVEVFSQVLNNEIPENTVLSHDLLEGSYLRCGLASDIMMMDGYPTSYNSSKSRIHRWIRGDYQISRWIGNQIIDRKQNAKRNPLNRLSKYKIMDNLIRAITSTITMLSIILLVIFSVFLNVKIIDFLVLLLVSIIISTIIDIINKIIYKKDGESFQKTFTPRISSSVTTLTRGILEIMALPDKASYSANAIIKTIYRLTVSKKHLLEWTTSEDAEKIAKTDIISYYKSMYFNIIVGGLGIAYAFVFKNQSASLFIMILSILWLIGPAVFWYISKIPKEKSPLEDLNSEEKKYLLEIGRNTWKYFKDSMTEENNYLPPDNYQVDRKEKFVDRTSSTNIGLGLLSVVSSYDLGYENLEDTLRLLNKMLITIENLQKWNGHLYNWYNIKTLQPLIPRYISTVDSGNFIGYVYVLKEFYLEIKKKLENQELEENAEKRKELLELIPDWVEKPNSQIPIANADFTKLYDVEKQLFSIGFNIEENKLTDSYYDLLASEARQASLVAISKKDVASKHWYKLSRTLTTVNGYNGLISWSGTAFEYLMPNIIIKQQNGSLLDESCKFMIMAQKQYAKKLGIPWGFSETAYYLKDLNNNYQYKAIGIPWLGLKRGLEEDMVVASYASIMALIYEPKDVIQNIKNLEKEGMYNNYGFYESIDYTPIRMQKGKKNALIKTFMAHHQALILLSINNLFTDEILQKRFSKNPEINAVEILLQEKMPESMIITKENKVKPTKITYKDYENYAQRIYTKVDNKLPISNVIANENYSIVMDEKGAGYSKYKDYIINRYKPNSDETQGIFFYFKNIKNKRIWTSSAMNYLAKPDKYEMIFTEHSDKIKRIDGSIESNCNVTVSHENPVEIRRIELTNNSLEEQTIEITTAIEPALATLEQHGSHPAFQNLFLVYEYLEEENIFIIKRKDRENTKRGLYLAVSFYTEDNVIGDLEYEIDKEKFQGRGNLMLPAMVENSKPFSKKIQPITDPILALRRTITIKPMQKVSFSLLLSVSEEKEDAIQNVKEYQNEEKIKQAYELSKARADTEARYLRLKANEIETYQKMLGYIIFSNPIQKKEKFKQEYYPKEELWQYGISGDLPILLVKIQESNEAEILAEVLKAYEFYRLKNIQMDLVILNEESNSYEKNTKETIQNAILNANLAYLQNIKGGIFILEDANTEAAQFYSKLIINTKKGPLERQIQDLEEEYIENQKEIGNKVPSQIIDTFVEEKSIDKVQTKNDLLYENEYGGFSKDGKEYIISIKKENRLPTVWSHIMANDNFGTLVTDSMGGYTWSKNSNMNKITSWSNNQVVDNPSEIIYMQEQETLKTWSLGLNPMPDNKEYKISYGFGYTNYEHFNMGIEQNLTVFVPKEDSLKVSLLELKNAEPKKKKLNLFYYIKPVLGEDDIKTNGFISMKFQENSNMLLLQNKTNNNFKEMVYITSSEKIKSYTGNKKFFFEQGNLSNPEGLKKFSLDNVTSFAKDNIAVVQIEVELEAFERKQISFLLGSENNILDCQDKAYKYIKIPNIQEELEEVKKYWKNVVEKLQVTTPMESFNILMNGWLIYQTITSRLRARTAFYQAGGAFGFRDQLQDTIALKYFSTDAMKNQIIKHSKHQFVEGDVEHWWHEETSTGIRTRFSDDLLWLVYIVEQYIQFTGDMSILDIETSYVEADKLENGVNEKYDKHLESSIKESIFMHCQRAIQKSMQFGENDLPKIGSGDWNDALSKVGDKGKGESVWLGFFMYDILINWIPICEKLNATRQDKNIEEKIQEYKKVLEMLKKSLNNNAWDGRWYRRAFMDDGSILGTLQNEECKIDGIAQSWSVISNAGDNDKKYICMESLENHLIDRGNGIIKLLDPPFEKSNLEPGYIKAYLPGTRENGGQYTHAAIWAIIAEAILGFGDKATDLFRMINPIEHSRTKETASKYKVEPYVVAADIYGAGNLAGRGGWTWYTGSSSWMYEAGIKYILGLNIFNGYLSIMPAIPSSWKEYSIRYKNGSSVYNIQVKNPNSKSSGIDKMIVNGQIVEEKKIYLNDDGKIYNIEVIM